MQMTTFNLTEKEFKAARIFVETCLDGMGGKRPSDLEYDEYTWIDANDLISNGHTRHEAAGLMSSLSEKGFIAEYDNRPPGGAGLTQFGIAFPPSNPTIIVHRDRK